MKLHPQSVHIRRQDPRRNSRDMADNTLTKAAASAMAQTNPRRTPPETSSSMAMA